MRKIVASIKLEIFPGKAMPVPPISSILGQNGINIMEFCKLFNSKTNNCTYSKMKIPTLITLYNDKSFDLKIKQPTITSLVKNKLNIKKGSGCPGTLYVKSIEYNEIVDIARIKKNDMYANNLESSIKSVIGTIKSMGIEIKNNIDNKL